MGVGHEVFRQYIVFVHPSACSCGWVCALCVLTGKANGRLAWTCTYMCICGCMDVLVCVCVCVQGRFYI